jgi:type I restriction enzyme, R subunit
MPIIRSIEELQSPDWWQDVTAPMLEQARKKLRSLVPFIEKRKRKVLFSDFRDEIGEEVEIDLLGVAPWASMERFRAKLQAFLRRHEDHIAIHRLRMNKPLTADDLCQLEQMLLENGIADAEHLHEAAAAS